MYVVDNGTRVVAEDEEVQAYLLVHFRQGPWQVEFVGENDTAESFEIDGGWRRLKIRAEVESYVLWTVPAQTTSMATSMATAMTPVVPDIRIRTNPNCPPPT